MNIESLLNAVGKMIFVKYYYYFKDYDYYKTSDFINIITEDFTEKSKRSRAGHAHMIFYNNLHIEALTIIAKSRVSEDTKARALELLKEELS